MSEFTALATPTLPSFGSSTHTAAEEAAKVRGYAAGYAEGARKAAAEAAAAAQRAEATRQAALADMQAQLDAALAVLGQAAAALRARTVPTVQDATQTLTDSALDLAESIIGYQITHDAPGAARAALTRALDGMDPALVVAVRLHPADIHALPEEVRAACPVDLVPDQTITPGDAVSMFEDGYLDARITTAVDRARAALATTREVDA